MVSELIQWLNAAMESQASPLLLPCHRQCICSNKHHSLSKQCPKLDGKGQKGVGKVFVSRIEFTKLSSCLYKPLG